MKPTKLFVAEVSYDGRIDEYDVEATDKVHGRDLVVNYLAGGEKWKRIVLDSTPGKPTGTPRVIGRRS